MTRFLLHADADAFFASVVMRRRPDLRRVPMAAVAHVFVASANYPARALGVRGGMPVQEARALCPSLVLVDLPRDEIEEASDALFDLFASSARAVEPGSMEEAFLDVGASDESSALAAARELRRRAADELGLPVSVGIGSTKLIAKLASRAAKPDGLVLIGSSEEADLRERLPLVDAWGVGPVSRERLRVIGVERLADLDAVSDGELTSVCGLAMARRLRGYRTGTDDAVVRPVEERRTLSSEGTTTGYDRADHSPSELVEACLARVCRRARRAGLVATGLSLALRPASGGAAIVLRRARADASADEEEWGATVQELLAGAVPPPLSGAAVTLTGLAPRGSAPLALF
ncbi:Y-family DNA polymerase [Rathayibacter sp. Leaf248]|uniref:Y-family DNA polymerase n=1 Tax=Rathayibacter sp. Leaf248 TaxID=2876555 RepID=UPI001E5BB8F3|nr:DNA polymerase IV [Rathayibacter sp. Leaf248]